MKLFRYMNLRYDSLKNLLVFIISVIMLQSFSTAQSLDSLIEEAITNNPQLKSQQFKIKASEFRAESINNYPAPNASLEFSQVPITNPIFPTQALSINLGLSQMFPLGDKLGAMTEVERRNSKIEGDSYAEYKVDLIGKIKMSYYTLWLTDRKIVIQKKSIQFLADLMKSMETALTINRINQVDLLTIQSEIASSETQLLILGKQRDAENYRLNRFLGRELDATGISIPEELEGINLTINQSKLENLLAEINPTLKKMNNMIEMNRAMIEANDRELIPDLMLQGMFMVMPRGMILTSQSDLTMLDSKVEFMYSLMVSINLPFAPWSINKYKAKSQELAAGISGIALERTNMQREMGVKLKEATVKYSTASELLKLYDKKIIPLYKQTTDSQVSAYQNNKSTITAVIDSYRMLLMVQMNYYMAKADTQMSLAEIEMMVGGKLTDY
ncbi:MAG: TolC family protein [Ignavibacteriales bacterium]|jgi:cobalt-zinc-cadmium efflux system outer membrane protein|nr:TolC family protein [Ignavibacteriales bacterium]